jgi:aspartate-semialdehyde dehydrogenase
MCPIKVGVLGATGMVGQRLVQLLDRHPWFTVTELAASERSSGKTYAVAMQGRWKLSTPIPEAMARLTVKECTPGLDCQMVFSALDADAAGPIEMAFAKAGYIVSSNARNYRMEPDVPLIIPEVNADHLGLIPQQKKNRGWKSFIVTDPNCTTIMLTLALKPLARFGLRTVMVTSMQALSGAGYPGVASLDSVDNVIPYIIGEEDKVESETLKLLGQIKNGMVEPAAIGMSAQCNRVNVTDGHTECVSVKLDQKVSRDDLAKAIEEFNPLKELGLPTAPSHPLILRSETDRPQPRLDRDLGKGMTVSVGRLRPCHVLDYKFVVMGHNTIRGAAGAAILNAELMKAQGYL